MNFVVFSPCFLCNITIEITLKKTNSKKHSILGRIPTFWVRVAPDCLLSETLSISLFGVLMQKSILLHICVLYHSVMPESVHDCPFFFRWANTVYCFTVALIIILSFLDTALVLYLGNIQSGNLETVFF